MKSKVLAVVLLFSLLGGGVGAATAATAAPDGGSDGILFIQNVGQFPPEVRFYVHGLARPLWLGDDGLVVPPVDVAAATEVGEWVAHGGLYAPYGRALQSRSDWGDRPAPAWDAEEVGAAPSLTVGWGDGASPPVPFGRLATRVHVYPSADPATWREEIPVWRGVRYREVAPGVDLEITASDGRLAWRLTGRVGAAFDLPLHVSAAGNEVEAGVALTPPAPTLSPLFSDDAVAPMSTLDNPVALLAGTYLGSSASDYLAGLAVGTDGTVYVAGDTAAASDGFTAPLFVASFDADLTTLRYLTFFGDAAEFGYDSVSDVAVDGAGNAYVVGTTFSRQFPVTASAFDTVLNDGRAANCTEGWTQKPCPDAYIVRLNGTGQLTYGAYLGGAEKNVPGTSENLGGDDHGVAVGVDGAGRVYVVGQTNSDDFRTTPGAYDRTFSYIDIGLNPDVFLVKINPAGGGASDLLYATYVGAGFPNDPHGIAVDGSGVVYVTGAVDGNSGLLDPKIGFPTTPGAYPNTSECIAYICEDLFFFKLDPAGRGSADLLYGTFFGGTADAFWETEYGADVAVAADGTVALVGVTETPDFPTTSGAFMAAQPSGASRAAVVARLNPAGQGEADLLYSTYLGGGGMTEGMAVAVDDGQIYVTGKTSAAGFPFTLDAFDTTPDGQDGFLTCIDPQAQGVDSLVYSTFLGGAGSDEGCDLQTAADETVYVAGSTGYTDFPVTPDAYDPTWNGYIDGFAVRLFLGTTSISGRVTDEAGNPVAGMAVNATGGYEATTGDDGRYTIADLPPGTYTVTAGSGYFWTPTARSVTAPPDATGEDFVGRNIRKMVTPTAYRGTLMLSDRLTYTVQMVFPDGAGRSFYDAVPTYTTYVTGSLVAPGGVIYDPAAEVITGPLTFTPGAPFSVTFAVQSEIVGTVGFAPLMVNRACFYPASGTTDACTWSNEVRTFSYARQVYLPLVLR